MKANELARIVSDLNWKHLNELCGKDSDLPEGPEIASRQTAPTVHRCKNGRCFSGLAGPRCFSGVPDYNLENTIILRSPANPSVTGKVAVVATIDKETGSKEASNRDLPVVLAIGINYGQMGTHNYLANPVLLWDATGMRTKLDKAITLIGRASTPDCPHPEFPAPHSYHLVATNFFPWITQKSWSSYGFNSIREMLIIGCYGFSDPLAHIKELCQKLGTELAGVVFHGANNAVPYMGAEFLRTHSKSLWQNTMPDIVFCGNLGRLIGGGDVFRLCHPS